MKKIALLLMVVASSSMTAQSQLNPSVEVTGEGIVMIVPDQVSISVRVENTGSNPKELKQRNDRTIAEVLEFVKGMGIKNKYVQTDFVRLSKNYEYNTKTYNYVANQSLTIKLMDLKKYEPLMNGLLETGINRIDGLSFSSSEMESLKSQARKKAIENAKMKAEEYASVLGQSIGKATQISEFQKINTPGPLLRSAMAMDSESSKQTLAPGEMQVSVKVNVSFVLN
ncbi:MAG: SIMPL domain-containing protein [Bacteroidota bacterium]